MELVYDAVPDPSFVVLSDIVGLDEVLQQIPFAVIEYPPSLDIVPPLDAVVPVIEETAVVVRIGTPIVVNVIWFPYAVPILFVA